jgi:hypothetical protein
VHHVPNFRLGSDEWKPFSAVECISNTILAYAVIEPGGGAPASFNDVEGPVWLHPVVARSRTPSAPALARAALFDFSPEFGGADFEHAWSADSCAVGCLCAHDSCAAPPAQKLRYTWLTCRALKRVKCTSARPFLLPRPDTCEKESSPTCMPLDLYSRIPLILSLSVQTLQ